MSLNYAKLVANYCDHADTCVGPNGAMYILASYSNDFVLLKYAPTMPAPVTLVSSFKEQFSSHIPEFCKFGLGASIALVENTLYCYVPIETAQDCATQQGEQVCLYLIEVPSE